MGFLLNLLGKWADSANDRRTSAQKYVPGYLVSFDWCRYRRNSHCWFSRMVDYEGSDQASYPVFIPRDRGLCPFDDWEDQKRCPVSEPGSNIAPCPDPTWPWSQGGWRNRPVIQLYPAVGNSPPAARVNPRPGFGTSIVEIRSRGDLLELAARYGISQNSIFEVHPTYEMGHRRVRIDEILNDALAYPGWSAGESPGG